VVTKAGLTNLIEVVTKAGLTHLIEVVTKAGLTNLLEVVTKAGLTVIDNLQTIPHLNKRNTHIYNRYKYQKEDLRSH
jgi:hypothetical protein